MSVCVCSWEQKDESGAYLLLISVGHYLCFTLTLFIMVTQTHMGSTDLSFLPMVISMAKI